MIASLLYQVRIKKLSKTRVEITLVPTWLGRVFKRRVRQGPAFRAKDADGDLGWWWEATDRHVGSYVERYIEAAPLLAIEDMTIEQLLLDAPVESSDHAVSVSQRSKKKSPAP
jgi:hypothetical protein